jgi:HPt (histidine-containing phosphotransfer) domain-containing protein
VRSTFLEILPRASAQHGAHFLVVRRPPQAVTVLLRPAVHRMRQRPGVLDQLCQAEDVSEAAAVRAAHEAAGLAGGVGLDQLADDLAASECKRV